MIRGPSPRGPRLASRLPVQERRRQVRQVHGSQSGKETQRRRLRDHERRHHQPDDRHRLQCPCEDDRPGLSASASRKPRIRRSARCRRGCPAGPQPPARPPRATGQAPPPNAAASCTITIRYARPIPSGHMRLVALDRLRIRVRAGRRRRELYGCAPAHSTRIYAAEEGLPRSVPSTWIESKSPCRPLPASMRGAAGKTRSMGAERTRCRHPCVRHRAWRTGRSPARGRSRPHRRAAP